MKKSIRYFIIIIVSVAFYTCKKGEDDPAFTLMTRKARLAGDWKMMSGSLVLGITDSTGAYASLRYTLKENRYILDEIGRSVTSEANCNLSVSFTKKGNVTIVQTMDSLKITATGKWDFEGKVGASKNKESVRILLGSINNYSDRFRMFNKAQMQFSYRIKELRNKRLVLESDKEMILLDSGAGIYVTSEYVFAQ